MKTVIVSSSYAYLERVELLKACYEKRGYETEVLITDFIHASKSYVNEQRENYTFIKTKPYKKNISVQRLYSRYRYAKDAFAYLKDKQVDLLHVLLPANSLAKEAKKYKEAHPNTKLYFDIIDLWPETLPIQRFKNLYPFEVWRRLRDDNLDNADKIYCECSLFRKVMGRECDPRFHVLYWAKKDAAVESVPSLSDTELHLCYLGSINNVIDIDYILKMCTDLGEKFSVVIHIIGDGERREELLQKLSEVKVDVVNHGLIYDAVKKQKIFDQCHYGLNIMKSTVCVGLTMKSLDYFQGGLPIINNITGDTAAFVDEYEIGYNGYDEIQIADNSRMRENVKRIFEQKFTREAFERSLNDSVRDDKCPIK